MKRMLSIILISVGIVEIIIAVIDVKMPILIAIALGIVFIVLGVKTLLDVSKKK